MFQRVCNQTNSSAGATVSHRHTNDILVIRQSAQRPFRNYNVRMSDQQRSDQSSRRYSRQLLALRKSAVCTLPSQNW